jgi:hypothetical protein
MGITHLISKHNYSNFGGVNSYKRTIVFFFVVVGIVTPFANTTIPILVGPFFFYKKTVFFPRRV